MAALTTVGLSHVAASKVSLCLRTAARFIPDRKDPKRCKLHCAQKKCPAVCDVETGGSCYCPEGFIREDNFCHDFDECFTQGCDHVCHNTYGSFKCSCRKGFVLKDTYKCVRAPPVVTGVVKPTTSYSKDMVMGPSASSSSFLWLWIFIALVIVASIFVIRFYVVRKQICRRQTCRQQPSVSADTAEA
ncbi:unnamed protein product [Tetraodon nigroviridis]|uniref:Thrombomodulin n=1 Tax=Tetraodon nigroviridis TaxID=99883 RepID=Q4SK30_TETNG|nr:unnamed protein product [Tetraodon nigroviridis]